MWVVNKQLKIGVWVPDAPATVQKEEVKQAEKQPQKPAKAKKTAKK